MPDDRRTPPGLDAQHFPFECQAAEAEDEQHAGERRVDENEPRFADRESALNVRIEKIELGDRHRRKTGNRREPDTQLRRQHRNGQCAELVRLKRRPRAARRPVAAGDPERDQHRNRVDQERD